MLIDSAEIVAILRRIVARAAVNPSLHDDLMQEALVHLWQQELQRPGQRPSWYLQSCRYHLQNHLQLGRSIDSLKRCGGSPLSLGQNGTEDPEDETPDDGAGVFAEVSAADMVALLTESLTPVEERILALLLNGFSLRETAVRLKLSHPAVAKHRRRMARMAALLGIAPAQGSASAGLPGRRPCR